MVPSPPSRFHRPIGRLSFTVVPLLVASALLAACGPESTFQVEKSDGLPWGVIFRASAAPTEPAPAGDYQVFGAMFEDTNIRTAPREVTIR